MYKLFWKKKATKQFKKIDRKERKSIFTKIELLQNENCSSKLDIKKLVNHEYEYRLRIGQYRVFFEKK